ncbi:unnamed protein product [Bemisia tabaci]|uniref:Uncharacterized protein n=2 Tax=Bemisia tabaci TaxID=7038 RepID=A0A9P0G5H8_BEMTA|nr:unnamed protein product [Bemisia tabaci]
MPCSKYIECLIFVGIEASSSKLKHGEDPGGVRRFVVVPSIEPESERSVLDLFSADRVQIIRRKNECPATLITAIKNRRAAIQILFLCPSESDVYVEYNLPGDMGLEITREIGGWLPSTGHLINFRDRNKFYEVAGREKIRSVFEDYGSLQIIFQLIKFNSDIHYRSRRGTTFLHLAIEARCEPLVQCLLENGADIEKKTSFQETALQLAIECGSPISILKILINHGADINANYSMNSNPLILALRQESYGTDTIKFLLDSGANVNSNEEYLGVTDNAIEEAAVRSPDILSCILNYRPQLDNTVLRRVIHRVSDLNIKDRIDDLNVSIDKLLENGFDLDPNDASDVELLIGAVKVGNMELVLRLINLGARPCDVSDCDGWTALHEAASESGERMIRVLVDHGADVYVKTAEGDTPLTVAAKHGNLEAFRFLLSLGANIKENPYLLYAEHRLDLAGHLSSCREPPTPNEFLLMLEYPYPFLAKDLRFDQISYIALWIKDLLEYDFLSFERIENLLENDNFDPDLNSTMTLCEHIEALMVADLSINKNLNGNEILDKLGLPPCSEDSTRKYGIEIAAMKEKVIEGSVISFRDVLEATLPQIVNFLYNNSIFETLKNSENYLEFPSYTGMISRRFRKAYFRKLLVDQGVKMLNILFTTTGKLPFRILRQIVTYLSNQELLILSSVFKTPSDKRFIDNLCGILSNNPSTS